MGDGFGEPQTSARVPAFVEHATPAPSDFDEDLPLVHLNDSSLAENPAPAQLSQQPTPTTDAPITQNTINSTQLRRRFRRRAAPLRSDSSVRDRLFQLEERRAECDRQRNEELAGIRVAVVELCRLMQQFLEQSRTQQ